MRFKKPKYRHFNHYCYDCDHYKFEQQIGCAYLGKCYAISDDITTVDAYDPPCGLWKEKERAKKK